ncbi:MAG: hypothetical protein JW889_16915 [Verrucomicrobia bacterium]|nr:hypothetical protein [Verrucomicrobiota bacterium]
MNTSGDSVILKTAAADSNDQSAGSVFRHPEVIAALAVALLMIALVPYALSFDVYERIYTDGAHKAPLAEDPQFAARVCLITLGLALPFVSLSCFVASVGRRPDGRRKILMAAIVLYTFVLGWCCYPYWVNGVHRATRDFVVCSGLDPKPLLPAIWFGDWWWTPAALLPLVGFIGMIVLSVATCRTAAKHREIGPWLHVMIAWFFLMFLTAAFTPNYMTWILD